MIFIIRSESGEDLDLPDLTEKIVTRTDRVRVPKSESRWFELWCKHGSNVQISGEFATREVSFKESVLQIDSLEHLMSLSKDSMEIYPAEDYDVDGIIYLKVI